MALGMKYELAPLPYGYDSLEPYIDEGTMHFHHDKHHQTYADKLNAALERHPELFGTPIEKFLADTSLIPEDIRLAVINHGGGYVNHNLFWESMTPNGGGEPTRALADAINATFGSFDEFKKKMSEVSTNHFGSGWGWLTKDKNGKLNVYSLPNQDSPVSLDETPLLLIDVWEHAYYLKYQNRRAEFVENIWNIIDWEKVAERYAS